MTYPSPPGDWQDPAWSGQPSTPPADPLRPAGDPPTSGQPYGTDPYAAQAPYASAPYAVSDPYAAAAQQAAVQPAYADPYGGVGKGAPGYPAPGYPPYGYPPPAPTNGMAVGAMIVSIIGAVGLCGYGLGGYLGIVGAILGHVAKRQIRERGENGAGMATAGIIVGWIAAVIAVLATIAWIVLVVWAVNQEPSTGTGVSY